MWTEIEFRAAADQAGRAEDRTFRLVALLREDHEAFIGGGAGEVERRRGWILVELSRRTLGPEALPYVLEELESGSSSYLAAAAARALRQAPCTMPAFGPPLARTIRALASRNDLVDLERWGGVPVADGSPSALDEVVLTLKWLGPDACDARRELELLSAETALLEEQHRAAIRGVLLAVKECSRTAPEVCRETADCCLPLAWRRRSRQPDGAALRGCVALEDHDGTVLTWNEYFVGRPTVVAFFYTRCDNEAKCSLTISKLAQLKALLKESAFGGDVRLAAITYDPAFDDPLRLRRFAKTRGLELDADCRAMRATSGFEELSLHFQTQVGFVGSLVNRHRIELFVLDARGHVAVTYERLGWSPGEVLSEVRDLHETKQAQAEQCTPSKQLEATAIVKAGPVIWTGALALLPKCPICGAAYLSVTGLAALPTFPGWSRFWPVVLVLLLLNLAALLWISRSTRRWTSIGVSIGGSSFAIGLGLAADSDYALVVGAAIVLIGSVWSIATAAASTAR